MSSVIILPPPVGRPTGDSAAAIPSAGRLLHQIHTSAIVLWHGACRLAARVMNMKRNRNQMLTLALCASVDVNYLNLAAAMIRELPRVLRVRVDLDTRRLEILYRTAPGGLLQEIHTALLAAGNEMPALRAY